MRYHAHLADICAEEGGTTLGPAYASRPARGLPLAPLGGFVFTGIEIEVENVSVHELAAPEPWSVVPDGSLRNSGMELLSRPIRTLQSLRQYCNKYTELRHTFPWRDSIRTSTHVHLDARSMRLQHLVKLLAAYNVVEPFLYRHCGAIREENIYCVPLYRADTLTENVVSGVISGRFDQVLREACKYSGLYVGPISTFGTVEFRMAPSFRTGAGVMEWVLMLHHFYNAALAANPEWVHSCLDRGEYAPVLAQLLPEELMRHVPPVGELADIIEENTCDTRAMALYDLFLPRRERAWVCPEMPAVERLTLAGVAHERLEREDDDDDEIGRIENEDEWHGPEEEY